MKYSDFLHQELKKKPSHISFGQYMKQLAHKWKQMKDGKGVFSEVEKVPYIPIPSSKPKAKCSMICITDLS